MRYATVPAVQKALEETTRQIVESAVERFEQVEAEVEELRATVKRLERDLDTERRLRLGSRPGARS